MVYIQGVEFPSIRNVTQMAQHLVQMSEQQQVKVEGSFNDFPIYSMPGDTPQVVVNRWRQEMLKPVASTPQGWGEFNFTSKTFPSPLAYVKWLEKSLRKFSPSLNMGNLIQVMEEVTRDNGNNWTVTMDTPSGDSKGFVGFD